MQTKQLFFKIYIVFIASSTIVHTYQPNNPVSASYKNLYENVLFVLEASGTEAS